MNVQEKCFCTTPFALTVQQLQNMHATKYNQICMHTKDTTCLVQEPLTKFWWQGLR